jgi:hypothetical protein
VAPSTVVVAGLIVFGAVFALNSAVHSYLILAYTDSDKVAMSVGFYYMANAAGRLAGTVLSGALYQWGLQSGPSNGLIACLWASSASCWWPACCRCCCHATSAAQQADQARRSRRIAWRCLFAHHG